jgi:hypothetical protein
MPGRDYNIRSLFPPGNTDLRRSTSFSGADTNVVFSIPIIKPVILNEGTHMESVTLQTLTISSASSVLPVRRAGESKARHYTKGARTFAGSMVFTVLGQDPFQQIASVDALNNTVRGDGHWHIDQMPPFDAIILCANEMGESGMQMIHNITLTNWGTTYSVDDMYIESSYTYVAEHVSPFITGRFATLAEVAQIHDRFNNLKAFDVVGDDATIRELRRMSDDMQDIYGNTQTDLRLQVMAPYANQLISAGINTALPIGGLNYGTVGMFQYNLFDPGIPPTYNLLNNRQDVINQ